MGLSQKELSGLLGVSRSLLSLCEMGRRLLPVEAISSFMALYRKMKEKKEGPQNLPAWYADFRSSEISRLKSEAEFKLSHLELMLSKLLREQKELENSLLVLIPEEKDPLLLKGLSGLEHKYLLLQEKLALLSVEVEITLPLEIEKARKAVEVLSGW